MAGKSHGAAKSGPSQAAKLAHIREATMGFHKETMAANEHKMVGSEKQIAWAKDIRKREMADLLTRYARDDAGDGRLYRKRYSAEQVNKARSLHEMNTSAKHWIDQRVGDGMNVTLRTLF